MNKYELYLQDLQEGDIIFTRGKSILARLIQKVTKCYFNHCGIVFLDHKGVPTVLESLAEGATYTTLKERVESNRDFTIYRPNYDEDHKLQCLQELVYWIEIGMAGAAYDVWLFIKIGLNRLINKKWFIKDNKESKDICSELVRRYTNLLGIPQYTQKNMMKLTGHEWIVPEEFLIHNDGSLTKII